MENSNKTLNNRFQHLESSFLSKVDEEDQKEVSSLKAGKLPANHMTLEHSEAVDLTWQKKERKLPEDNHNTASLNLIKDFETKARALFTKENIFFRFRIPENYFFFKKSLINLSVLFKELLKDSDYPISVVNIVLDPYSSQFYCDIKVKEPQSVIDKIKLIFELKVEILVKDKKIKPMSVHDLENGKDKGIVLVLNENNL